MTNAMPERITARTFSRIFEKMCNFIAVARTGDSGATIRGLVMLCLLEFPDEHFDTPEPFRVTIETLFGLAIPETQIQVALDELERTHAVLRPGNSNYRLEPTKMASLKQGISDAQDLEDRVRVAWFEELAATHSDLPTDEAWKMLRIYLSRTFRRHGIQAAALLDPSIDTSAEHQASLTCILKEAINGNGYLDPELRRNVEASISAFMSGIGNDPDRSRYIAQLADGAFNFYTLEVPADLSERLRQQLQQLTLFLDTNFLFGILDLHNNTQVQVSLDLLKAIATHKLPFRLRYHSATEREMRHTISYYSSILRSRLWSRSLSRAASLSGNLSGIEQKFHERNAATSIDVEEFLRSYEHFDHILAEKSIEIYRPHEERSEARNDLFHEYQAFLNDHGREDKAYETVMHDAVVLEQARHLRTNAVSSLEAGALIISCDYYLYRFDWESSRRNGHRPCVLTPNIFWQVLRPFVPADQDFEKGFVETFALPEFRAIGGGGSKACSKMLQILATYENVPEQTAMKMLANGLLLDQLRAAEDETQFAERVEAAFVDENRNLLEEKTALEKEVRRQRTRAENETRIRQEEQAKFDAKQIALNKVIEDAGRRLDAANRKIEEHKVADIEASAKRSAERTAFQMSILAGLACSILAAGVFVGLVQLLPWSWLVSHKNAIPLQILASLSLSFAILGLLIKPWRKWCWGTGAFTMLITLLTLLGG